MAHDFRPYSLDQQCLLPDRVRETGCQTDISRCSSATWSASSICDPIYREYPRGRGPRGYHPQMLLTVLLYGYCVGVFSSRRMAADCETDVAFRVLIGRRAPGLPNALRLSQATSHGMMQRLFVEVLGLCREAGLVKLGHLSLDGSKYQANAIEAQGDELRSDQGGRAEARGRGQGASRAKAEADDREEDEEHGWDKRGDELPEELQRRESRLDEDQRGEGSGWRSGRERGLRSASWRRRELVLRRSRRQVGQPEPHAQGAEQLHRSRQSDHEDEDRAGSRATTPAGGRWRERGDRRRGGEPLRVRTARGWRRCSTRSRRT